MALEIRTTAKHYEDEPLTGVIYGLSGNGKTVVLSTLPRPFLVITEPDGVKSIRGMGRTVDYVEAFTFADMKIAIAEFREQQKRAIAKDGDRRWDSFCLDSLTGLEERLIEEILPGKGMHRDEDKGALSLQGWGKLGSWHRIIRLAALDMRKLGAHVILTALPKEVSMPDGRQCWGPNVSGQAKYATPAAFSLVLGMDLKRDKKSPDGIQRFFRCKASPQWMAKDRSNCLNEREPADFRVLLKKCGYEPRETPADAAGVPVVWSLDGSGDDGDEEGNGATGAGGSAGAGDGGKKG